LLGFAVVKVMQLPAAQGITLIVVTSSPGGSYSNWWCSLFNASLALSVTMTAISTILSVVMLPANLLKKPVAELSQLRANGLTLLYYGIETGSRDILRRIRKGATPEGMIEGLSKARQAGLKTSCTVILGVGGKRRWIDHIESTAEVVNSAAPNYVSTLQLMLDETTYEDFMTSFGEPFEFQDDDGILAEQELFVSRLAPASPVIFRSNHASNALPLTGTLPKDKEKLLASIHAAREGSLSLRPGWARSL